jgi:hypothetical protein
VSTLHKYAIECLVEQTIAQEEYVAASFAAINAGRTMIQFERELEKVRQKIRKLRKEEDPDRETIDLLCEIRESLSDRYRMAYDEHGATKDYYHNAWERRQKATSEAIDAMERLIRELTIETSEVPEYRTRVDRAQYGKDQPEAK